MIKDKHTISPVDILALTNAFQQEIVQKSTFDNTRRVKMPNHREWVSFNGVIIRVE